MGGDTVPRATLFPWDDISQRVPPPIQGAIYIIVKF
jgi:hypothetical protein